MKVFLLHRDRDFDVEPQLRNETFKAMLSGNLYGVTSVRRSRERTQKRDAPDPPPTSDDVLTQDLELDTLWSAMAAGDEFLFEMAKRVVLSSLGEPDAIAYRQRVLADCLEHPAVVRQLYGLAIEALENERKAGGLWHSDRPGTILHRSVAVLKLHVDVLKRLRELADEDADRFRSDGFARFFAMIRDELADDYLQTVEQHLRELEFKRGVLQSAELAKGNKGRRYIVRRPREQRWTERLPFGNRSASYSVTIPPRDQAGFRALDEIEGKGLNLVANAVAQSADHIKSFFIMLRLELAFYLGCLNLRARLDEKGEPTCFPEPLADGPLALNAQEIYDVCLTLIVEDRVVGNDVDADGKSLVMITGANQGGKSTLLRSLGVAQLMMQSGMFVGAQSFRRRLRGGLDALQARRGRDDEGWQARRGASQDERHRRRDRPQLRPAVQRVVRLDQRARRLGDRAPGRARDARPADQGPLRDPHVRPRPRLLRPTARRRPVPARRAPARRPAHVQAPARRAAADELRRGLLPAHLRHRSGNTRGDRRDPALRR